MRIARLDATTSSAISLGPAPSTSSATSGTAVRVTTEPSSEIVWPIQSFMKSACRHSDAVTIRGTLLTSVGDWMGLPTATVRGAGGEGTRCHGSR